MMADLNRGITRDEETYPDPETFNPMRWLDPSFPTYREPLTQYPNLNGFSQFGFGRRTCQGIPIVEQDLFLAMGGMAWAFNISKKRDPVTGAEVPVHWNDYTPLLIAKPCQFPFDLTPRSEDKVVKMREMYLEAEAVEMREKEEENGYEFVPNEVVPEPVKRVVTMEDETADDSGSEVWTPEPGLSPSDSSSERDESEEEEVEIKTVESGLGLEFDERKSAWKGEPLVTVMDVPGAWRWA